MAANCSRIRRAGGHRCPASSTATGLMATSFAATGAIDMAPALVMLGANLGGGTLITQVLAFNAFINQRQQQLI